MEMRLDNLRSQTQSRLNSWRHVDVTPARTAMTEDSLPSLPSPPSSSTTLMGLPPLPTSYPAIPDTTSTTAPSTHSHARNHSTGAITNSRDLQKPRSLPRTKTFSDFSNIDPVVNSKKAPPLASSAAGNIPVSRRKVPAANSRNDSGLDGLPPPAMITQRSFPFESDNTTATTAQTQDWVASVAQEQQQQPPLTPAKSTRSSTGSTQLRPLILPIRAFKTSSRRSLEMATRRDSISNDPDSTIRALEGFEEYNTTSQMESEEQNSDESDLFLRAAKEEELAQRSNIHTDLLARSDKRKSSIVQRSALPPPSPMRRRGSDNDASTVSRLMDEREVIGQALTYRPRERPSALDDLSKSRYYGPSSRSNPTTPRMRSNREISPESQISPRSTAPEQQMNVSRVTSSYRQSNLSYSAPRIFNSSPLVSRSADMHMQESNEPPRGVEDTESVVSTTAPSTLWDELDELKSRIHRLELTGKLPTASGATTSRASSERPPTATTTVTTISSSPKRGRNNSISPIEPSVPESPENHPLLRSALAKSQPLVAPDIFKALEAAAADALAISSMMGTSGHPGPLSSQSTVGPLPAVSDRQVRRKADSMCRSLTELCLALSDVKHEQQPQSQVARPVSRDADVHLSIEPSNNQRLGMSTDLARAKSSPRALSRLEARRSSLLTGSSLPAPRYASTESNTPTQSSMASRRTSLLLRSTRRGTEELEEDNEIRFRAPSRAATDIGRIRNAPREYVSQEPLPERSAAQSALPVRRQYNLNSVPNTPPSMPPVSSLGGRRYLERATPERDTMSVVSRLGDDRAAQRKSSIGFPSRTNSLTRKARQPNSHSADLSAGRNNGYQT